MMNYPDPDPTPNPAQSTNKRKAGKAQTRQMIMRAARELFSRQGFMETSAEEIALQAKVGVGTIYSHFGDKDGLLREILLEAADDVYQRIGLVYQNSSASPLELARAHVETLVSYIEENGKTSSFVLSMMLSGHPTARPMLNRVVEQVEQNILQGQGMGFYRRDIQPHLAARAETQMNLGLLAWWAENPHRAAREEIIETLTRFRFSGLHANQPGEK